MDIGFNNKFFFYLSLGDKAATMEYMYDLSEDIIEVNLKLAVEDALEVFPFFRLKPYVDQDGKLVFKENDGKVPVGYDDGNKVSLGTSMTNGYLFRVVYKGKRITVVASHGIGDGRGISSFAQSVVYFYLTRCGISIDPEGMIYTKEDIGDPTLTDILFDKVKAMDINVTSATPDTEKEIFYPKNERVYQSTADTKQFRIIWEQDNFIEIAKSFGGTPVTFVHSVIASTMYDFYKLSDVKIVGNVPVDLRAKLESKAQSNFTSNVDLVITEEDLKLDMATQMTELRSRLKEATALENILGGVMGFNAISEYLDQISFSNKEMLDGLANQLCNRELARSYLLSNIGAVKLPADMVPYVTNVDIMFTNLEATPVFTMLTYENRGTLIIGQNYDDDGFIKALCDKFNSFGISVELMDCGLVRSDAVKPFEFERI